MMPQPPQQLDSYRFALIHLDCGNKAILTYYITEGYFWDGNEETIDPIYNLTLQCDVCKIEVEIEAKES